MTAKRILRKHKLKVTNKMSLFRVVTCIGVIYHSVNKRKLDPTMELEHSKWHNRSTCDLCLTGSWDKIFL